LKQFFKQFKLFSNGKLKFFKIISLLTVFGTKNTKFKFLTVLGVNTTQILTIFGTKNFEFLTVLGAKAMKISKFNVFGTRNSKFLTFNDFKRENYENFVNHIINLHFCLP